MCLLSVSSAIAVTGFRNRVFAWALSERDLNIAWGNVDDPPLWSGVECVSVMRVSFINSQHVLEAVPFYPLFFVRGGPIEGQALKDGFDDSTSRAEPGRECLITHFL